MKSIAESFGTVLCGFITSILVAILDVVVARMVGVDLFTLSVWFVVPVGALGIGCAAASGYYFGSLYFHKRPTLILLVQIVTIAALTQLLIYYLGYATMVLDDGRKVADFVPFFTYLDVLLTNTHYRFGRTLTDTGAAGNFGYWMASFQFLGFVTGGLAVYGFLKAKVVCQSCDLYLRPLAKRSKTFPDADAASAYYDRIFTLPVGGPEFAELVRAQAKAKNISQGAFSINTTLMGCPKCKAQVVDEKVQIYNGKEWKDGNTLNRRIAMPDGTDLAPVFRG